MALLYLFSVPLAPNLCAFELAAMVTTSHMHDHDDHGSAPCESGSCPIEACQHSHPAGQLVPETFKMAPVEESTVVAFPSDAARPNDIIAAIFIPPKIA
ncbi:MAG: hypothetical protein K1X53_14180 [Candidatus Sumerlaeaceae bacterium]|nr:hypothetical protein [Candidatus Sumerlaeaceae bacterium]